MNRCHVAVLLMLVSIVAGCMGTPRLQDDVTVANGDGLDRLIFGDYWEADSIPGGVGSHRFCIAEFNVEFVKERVLRLPDNRGLTSRKMKYERGLTTELPGRLLSVFVDRLESRGRSIVRSDAAVTSVAYRSYPKRPASDPALVQFDDPVPSCNGKMRLAEVQPVKGMSVLVGDDATLLAHDQALASELKAAVIRVKMRVGIHEGRATIEAGSHLIVTTPSGETGRLVSLRSLATHESVLRDYGFVPSTAGDFYVSKQDLFDRIDSLFLSYIALATEVLE